MFIDKYLPPKVLSHLVVEASQRSHSDDRRKEVRSVYAVIAGYMTAAGCGQTLGDQGPVELP